MDTEHDQTDLKADDDTEAPLLPGERDDWPYRWQKAFLATLSLLPDVSAACRVARIGRPRAYEVRNKSGEFAEAWDEALALAHDLVERRFHEWVTSGVPVRTVRTRRKTKGGVVIEEETIETESAERSATLMIFWLKAWKPERYRWSERAEITGADGGPIKVDSLDKIDRDIALLTAELEARARAAGMPPVPVED